MPKKLTSNPKGLAARWSPEQIDKAVCIVNDIHEDIDNRETRAELRQALAIYADMLHDSFQGWVDKQRRKEHRELMRKMDKVCRMLDKTYKKQNATTNTDPVAVRAIPS